MGESGKIPSWTPLAHPEGMELKKPSFSTRDWDMHITKSKMYFEFSLYMQAKFSLYMQWLFWIMLASWFISLKYLDEFKQPERPTLVVLTLDV